MLDSALMGTDRRTFLQFASMAPTAAVAGTAAARETPAKAADHALTCSAFEACVGDAFTFEMEAFGEVPARLSSVTAHPGCNAVQREGRFSIYFDAEKQVPQGSYRVHHAKLGDFVLFVSPKDAQEKTLEAVFNRL